MAKLRPTQFFNHTKEKALSSKQCVEIFNGVVFPIRAYHDYFLCSAIYTKRVAIQYDIRWPKRELSRLW